MTWSDDGVPTLDPSVNAFDIIAKIKAGVNVVIEFPQKEPASGGYIVLRHAVPANSVMEFEDFETGEIVNSYCAVLFGYPLLDAVIYTIFSSEYGTEIREGGPF